MSAARDKTETLRLLQAHKRHLAREYGVIDLACFGSTIRNKAGAASDVDILVTFDGPATSKRYFGVQFYLEDLLGRPINDDHKLVVPIHGGQKATQSGRAFVYFVFFSDYAVRL